MHYTNSAKKNKTKKTLYLFIRKVHGYIAVDLIHRLPEAKWINQDANIHTTRGCLFFFANLTNPFRYVVLSEAKVKTVQEQLNWKKTKTKTPPSKLSTKVIPIAIILPAFVKFSHLWHRRSILWKQKCKFYIAISNMHVIQLQRP